MGLVLALVVAAGSDDMMVVISERFLTKSEAIDRLVIEDAMRREARSGYGYRGEMRRERDCMSPPPLPPPVGSAGLLHGVRCVRLYSNNKAASAEVYKLCQLLQNICCSFLFQDPIIYCEVYCHRV